MKMLQIWLPAYASMQFCSNFLSLTLELLRPQLHFTVKHSQSGKDPSVDKLELRFISSRVEMNIFLSFCLEKYIRNTNTHNLFLETAYTCTV